MIRAVLNPCAAVRLIAAVVIAIAFSGLLSAVVAAGALPVDDSAQSVTPPMRAFGIVAKLGRSPDRDARELKLIRQLGASVVVITPDEWATNERVRGGYALRPQMRDLLAKIAGARLHLIVLLFRANKIYANPLDPVAFARYCGWLAGALRDFPVAAFQIWNEPANFDVRHLYGGSWNGRDDAPWVSKFADLTGQAAAAIRTADPHATIIVSLEGPPLVYALRSHPGDFRAIDGLSLHPYPTHLPAETVPWGGVKNELRDGVSVADADGTLASYIQMAASDYPRQYLGHPLGAWITEYGFPTCVPGAKRGDFNCVTTTQQAAYQARGMLVGFAHNVKVWCPYELVDDGDDPADAEQNFGLIESAAHDYVPKRAFYTLQRLARILGPEWRFTPRAAAALMLASGQSPCTAGPVSANGDGPPGVYNLWFHTAGGYAGFIWDGGPDRPGKCDGNLRWRAPDHRRHAVRIANLVDGQTVASAVRWDHGNLSAEHLPIGSDPIAIEIAD
jgi:hypothetical protein